MPFRQTVTPLWQRAEPPHAARQALSEHVSMACTSHAVGHHTGKRQAGAVTGQAVGNGTESLCHFSGIDQGHDWDTKALGNVSCRRLAVEQTHHALDQDQIRIGCSTRQAPAGISFAAHAEIEVLAGAATGESMYLRVKKIRAALENSDPSALPAMQACQGGGDSGLALARSGGCDKKSWAGWHVVSCLV